MTSIFCLLLSWQKTKPANAYASEEELKALSQVNRYQLQFTYRIYGSKEQHFRCGDITELMVRSTEVRKKYKLKHFQNMIITSHFNVEMF